MTEAIRTDLADRSEAENYGANRYGFVANRARMTGVFVAAAAEILVNGTPVFVADSLQHAHAAALKFGKPSIFNPRGSGDVATVRGF
jgi:hypothetical protein